MQTEARRACRSVQAEWKAATVGTGQGGGGDDGGGGEGGADGAGTRYPILKL